MIKEHLQEAKQARAAREWSRAAQAWRRALDDVTLTPGERHEAIVGLKAATRADFSDFIHALAKQRPDDKLLQLEALKSHYIGTGIGYESRHSPGSKRYSLDELQIVLVSLVEYDPSEAAQETVECFNDLWDLSLALPSDEGAKHRRRAVATLVRNREHELSPITPVYEALLASSNVADNVKQILQHHVVTLRAIDAIGTKS